MTENGGHARCGGETLRTSADRLRERTVSVACEISREGGFVTLTLTPSQTRKPLLKFNILAIALFSLLHLCRPGLYDLRRLAEAFVHEGGA